MMDGNDDTLPEGAVCTCKPSLFEQMVELGADEFYVELDLDSPPVDGSVRVLAITPKPKS